MSSNATGSENDKKLNNNNTTINNPTNNNNVDDKKIKGSNINNPSNPSGPAPNQTSNTTPDNTTSKPTITNENNNNNANSSGAQSSSGQPMSRPRLKEKSVILKEWTDNIRSNMDKFEEGAKLMVRKHQKSNIKTSAFAHTVAEMAQHETCDAIRNALEVLANQLTEDEKNRTVLLGQLQAHVVEQFDKYPPKVKIQKHNIEARNKAYSKLLSKQKDYSNARSNRKSEATISLSKDLYSAELKRMESSENTLNTSIATFEKERISDIKNLLKRYIQGQIWFFARSIEHFTKAYQAVAQIDSEAETFKFINMLKETEFKDGDVS